MVRWRRRVGLVVEEEEGGRDGEEGDRSHLCTTMFVSAFTRPTNYFRGLPVSSELIHTHCLP